MIDIAFDDRTDSHGRDPDSASPTLRKHHRLLWSKPLPNGQMFELQLEDGNYLTHRSNLGEYLLSSDSISNSLRSHKRRAHIISQVPAEQLDYFQLLGSTIGAKTLFPGNKVDGKPTINVARGFNGKIGDRMDLTLECIRLHYLGHPSPLGETLFRYSDFFSLFTDFDGYVSFFLLDDLIHQGRVKGFLPLSGEFQSNSLPNNLPDYLEYMQNTINFVTARNLRIKAWSDAYLVPDIALQNNY